MDFYERIIKYMSGIFFKRLWTGFCGVKSDITANPFSIVRKIAGYIEQKRVMRE